ncbi:MULTISPECIES: dethiobiotin synthase [Cysteiniphilum]|uniref:ATP-dependent dethiobiotin synthetase BioD n=1 Tax=Cysteiniphilum litorale TaxID=2056700 RepID=A0A8J2Z1Y1_9GAMM|nr:MULTISPECIES: dethiobiotin synthase [Cysteiniphilum]GGF88308.1 ATP-dependent dethiobiotin synthetase BioD [Cysteiniphilum litorale]
MNISSLTKLTKHKQIAIIGTDTEVGKTYVCVYLMSQLKKQGLTVAGLKPMASGAFVQDGCLVNEDALALQEASSVLLPYEVINPNVYEPAIAPHIAAEQANKLLTVEKLVAQTKHSLAQINSDITFIEGAGGLLTPLNFNETWADYLKALDIPVLLVVGMKLGCINHALLTEHYLKQQQIPCIGWIANCINPDMPVLQENILTLEGMLNSPKITDIQFNL